MVSTIGVVKWSLLCLLLNAFFHDGACDKEMPSLHRQKRNWLENLLGNALTSLNNGTDSNTDPPKEKTVQPSVVFSAAVSKSPNPNLLLLNISPTTGTEDNSSVFNNESAVSPKTTQNLNIDSLLGNFLQDLLKNPADGAKTPYGTSPSRSSDLPSPTSSTPPRTTQTEPSINISDILGSLFSGLQNESTRQEEGFNQTRQNFSQTTSTAIEYQPTKLANTTTDLPGLDNVNFNISSILGGLVKELQSNDEITTTTPTTLNQPVSTFTISSTVGYFDLKSILEGLANDLKSSSSASTIPPSTATIRENISTTKQLKTSEISPPPGSPLQEAGETANVPNYTRTANTTGQVSSTFTSTTSDTILQNNDIFNILGKLLNSSETVQANKSTGTKAPEVSVTTESDILNGNFLNNLLDQLLSKNDSKTSSTTTESVVTSTGDKTSTSQTTTASTKTPDTVDDSYLKDILKGILDLTYGDNKTTPQTTAAQTSGVSNIASTTTTSQLSGNDLAGILGEILNDIGSSGTEINYTESTSSFGNSTYSTSDVSYRTTTKSFFGGIDFDKIFENILTNLTTVKSTQISTVSKTSTLATSTVESTSLTAQESLSQNPSDFSYSTLNAGSTVFNTFFPTRSDVSTEGTSNQDASTVTSVFTSAPTPDINVPMTSTSTLIAPTTKSLFISTTELPFSQTPNLTTPQLISTDSTLLSSATSQYVQTLSIITTPPAESKDLLSTLLYPTSPSASTTARSVVVTKELAESSSGGPSSVGTYSLPSHSTTTHYETTTSSTPMYKTTAKTLGPPGIIPQSKSSLPNSINPTTNPSFETTTVSVTEDLAISTSSLLPSSTSMTSKVPMVQSSFKTTKNSGVARTRSTKSSTLFVTTSSPNLNTQSSPLSRSTISSSILTSTLSGFSTKALTPSQPATDKEVTQSSEKQSPSIDQSGSSVIQGNSSLSHTINATRKPSFETTTVSVTEELPISTSRLSSSSTSMTSKVSIVQSSFKSTKNSGVARTTSTKTSSIFFTISSPKPTSVIKTQSSPISPSTISSSILTTRLSGFSTQALTPSQPVKESPETEGPPIDQPGSSVVQERVEDVKSGVTTLCTWGYLKFHIVVVTTVMIFSK